MTKLKFCDTDHEKKVTANRHRRWLFMFSARVCACADFAIPRAIQNM